MSGESSGGAGLVEEVGGEFGALDAGVPAEDEGVIEVEGGSIELATREEHA